IKIIGSKAQKMSNSAVDADDLMQEGFLGLLDAVRTFDKTSKTKFSTYSNVCITNKMTTALIKSNRIDVPIEEVEESPIADQSH
ncbi:MAG: sigma factor, partial [Oscillospiraceae bacterium]